MNYKDKIDVLKQLLLLSFIILCSCENKTQENGSKSHADNLLNTIEDINKTSVDSTSFNKFDFDSRDFEIFYNKFRTDSTFQINRIKFPLKGHYNSYDEERDWEEKTWPLMKWDFRNQMNNPDDSVSIVQNSSRFFFGTYCKECGFSFEMQFDKIENKWYLTYRQENNY